MNHNTLPYNDTIAAIATPPGRAAIAMVRLSGPQALHIASRIWKGKDLTTRSTHTAHLGYIMPPGASPQDQPIDQALATIFRAPNSFTGEDMVEFGLHGSPLIARQTLHALMQAGARPAAPGEFSQRAVANGRMTLLQAEAAADLTAAASRAAQRIAMTQMRSGMENTIAKIQADLLRLASLIELELDFSEEDIQFADRAELLTIALDARTHLRRALDSFTTGQAIKDGIPVAIAGPTNAGKSSLLNALLGDDRAIVSDIHGTTRDIIEDTLEIGDYLFRFMDTAGLRDSDDPIERIGITRSRQAITRAAITLLVTDGTAPLPAALIAQTRQAMPPQSTLIIARNKSDAPGYLPPAPHTTTTTTPPDSPDSPDSPTPQKSYNSYQSYPTIPLSAKTGEGLNDLKDLLKQTAAQAEAGAGDILLTNARHRDCITQSLQALDTAISYLTPAPTVPTPTETQTEATPKTTTETTQTPPTITPTITPDITPDIIAQSLRAVTAPLAELTGEALTTPALLQNIFRHFCVGK